MRYGHVGEAAGERSVLSEDRGEVAVGNVMSPVLYYWTIHLNIHAVGLLSLSLNTHAHSVTRTLQN